jgi:prevent-host-death family protein
VFANECCYDLTCLVRLEVFMRTWQIQEAKAQFSELVRDTERSGPQEITWHGRSVAVVMSKADYERLSGANLTLVEFMRRSPLYDADDVEFERDTSLTREVDL